MRLLGQTWQQGKRAGHIGAAVPCVKGSVRVVGELQRRRSRQGIE